MKNFKFISVLILFTIHCSLFTASAQSWQELMDSTNFYQEKQDFQTALQWAEKAEAQAKKEFGENDINYASNLNTIARIYHYNDEIDSAVIYEEKALELYRIIFKGDHPDLAASINNMALFYKERGKYTKAESLYKEALVMRRRLYKSDNTDLASTINNLAVLYKNRGRYEEAEPLYKEALEMRRRLFKEDHPDLSTSINSMAIFYKERGRYEEAEPLYIEGLEMSRHLYKGDHPDLALSINNMAVFYLERGRYKEAESLCIEALEMRKRLFKGDNSELATSINNMASFYKKCGRYAEAEPLYKEALEMYRRLFKSDHPGLAMSINNMATFYDARGRYAEAESLFKEALIIYSSLFKGDHPDLARCINNIAEFLQGIGRYEEAELFFKDALEMRRRLFKSDHPSLVSSINNMAAFYDALHRYSEAEPLFKESLVMKRRLFKSDHPSLAIGINNMAYFYNRIGKYAEAEPLFNEALEMYRRIFKGNHPGLANSINNTAIFFDRRGRNIEAELLYFDALEMRRQLYNSDHPDLANSLRSLASYYYDRGRYKEAEHLYKEALEVYLNILINYFPSLSENEKGQFWNTMKSNFESFNSLVINRVNDNPSIMQNAFNNQLIIKGLLISSTQKVKNNILKSGDKNLIRKFEEWQYEREKIAKYHSMSQQQLKEKNINLDSVIASANDKEKELSRLAEGFSNTYKKKYVKWDEVQSSLNPDEAAIEIVRYRLNEKSRWTDTIYYSALIIKKHSKFPELVLLKNGKELENDYISNYYKSIKNQLPDNVSYKIFWEPIAKKLKGIKRVYISPDGEFNQINLATLMNPKTEHYLSDDLDIRVVTSTRDLVERHTPESPFDKGELTVELFGDPMFNLDSTKHLELASAIPENRTREFYNLGNTLDSTTRGGIMPLPSTRTEIEQIANEFTKKGWKVNTHLGEKALEEAVKGVDNPKVLHIATHGKFLKDIEIKDDDRMLGMETKRVVENPLLRSFLLFSGAENTLNDQKLDNQNTDDGLLTAYEAMNLNLDNTDLVVLSACETGLGEIKNGEGVYGLQRAFQQAGAKSIIMSLWTVPDKETQELMTNFYSKWLNGKDKRTAFNEARNEMRDKYHYPYFWGGFVMIGE